MAKAVSIRIKPELVEQLRIYSNREVYPYAPSMVAIVERGIQLALAELKKTTMKPRK